MRIILKSLKGQLESCKIS